MIRLTINIKYVVLLSYIVTTTNSYKTLILEITPETEDESNENGYIEDDDLFTNVKPVIRIVPSNYKTPPIEYDEDTQTVFVPQHRFNKRKLVEQLQKKNEENTLDMISEDSKKKQNFHNLAKAINFVLNALKGAKVSSLRQENSHEQKEPTFWDIKSNDTHEYPHYSIWNYWTYDKQLLVEPCPKGQVKVGSVCVWSPNHRN